MSAFPRATDLLLGLSRILRLSVTQLRYVCVIQNPANVR